MTQTTPTRGEVLYIPVLEGSLDLRRHAVYSPGGWHYSDGITWFGPYESETLALEMSEHLREENES